MAIKRIGNRPPTVLNVEQKIAAALLLFLFTGGVFFGIRSFGESLYRPIQKQFAENVTGKDVVNENSQEQKDIEALKKKDTDGDGLSDYDELYVYKTSPYLKDSDSDGVDDKTEVFGGTDPNCPTGKVCDVATSAATGVAEQTGDGTGVAENLLKSASGGSVSGAMSSLPTDSGKIQFKSKADVEAYFKQASTEQIKSMLIQSGKVKKEDLDKLSDSDLKSFFDNAVAQASASGQFDSMITSPSESSPPSEPTPSTDSQVSPQTNP